MLICPDWNRPLIIESLNTPLVAQYFWAFSGPLTDYILSPISYLEESTGPAIRLCINEIEFDVPTSWFIMVSDPDTYQLDTVPVAACANALCHAVLMSPDDSRYRLLPITVVDYIENAVCVHPMLQKGNGMQHPVGIYPSFNKHVGLTATIGPYDLYKYIENLAVGDIF
jgi:hypothetical protein